MARCAVPIAERSVRRRNRALQKYAPGYARKVGVNHVRTPGGNIPVNLINVVGLDCYFRAILRRLFWTFNYVCLRSIPANHCQRIVLIEHLESKAIHEEVVAFIHAIEEYFWN